MTSDALATLVDAVARVMMAHADELTELDRAIGDGDHGSNVHRGFRAVADRLDDLRSMPVPAAVEAVGRILVMTVGGAFGPLVGTALMTLGRALPPEPARAVLSLALTQALAAVKARGRSDAGHKTAIDVLAPVCRALADGADGAAIKAVATAAAQRTVAMQAWRGRAAFLGERSIGHMDPGARSASLMICAAVDALGGGDARRDGVSATAEAPSR